eukprot:snap_masked-scaffold_40-processed-gene-0.46-mRNA-1 protein AED:1.00 eAED:1.00 QI:0/0/0/0/1/1/2/0/60
MYMYRCQFSLQTTFVSYVFFYSFHLLANCFRLTILAIHVVRRAFSPASETNLKFKKLFMP